MKVDVSEGIDHENWAPLPGHDRVLVGGHTVWSGPFEPPVVTPQPNRWGVIDHDFPGVECLVEADPEVTGHLPLPGRVVGFVDRTHRPINAPCVHPEGRGLMEKAARLGKRLTQMRGVRLASSPFARTVPLVTPRDANELIRDCVARGVTGIRPLPGLAGGVALSVHQHHDPDQLDHIVAVLRAVVGR